MALNPMQKKARTSFLLGMLVTLVIAGVIIAFLIMQIGKLKDEQESVIYSSVYVAKRDLKAGEAMGITEEDPTGNMELIQVEQKIAPNNAINAINYSGYFDQKIEVTQGEQTAFVRLYSRAKIDIEKGTIVTTDMFYQEDESQERDVRLQEYNMISLPSQLQAKDYIDVRLRLPSGEDFIVLSKKYVEQADATTVWLKVDEAEIEIMSCAIVESYVIEGSTLYAVTYTNPGLQQKVEGTYIPTGQIVELMKKNPNISDLEKLAQRLRNDRNNDRGLINNKVEENRDNASSNVADKTAENLEKQQAARQEYLDILKAGARAVN